jgi:hypothetical protein
MAANTAPIFPATPWAGTAALTSVSACTTRHTVLTSNLTLAPCYAVALSAPSTNGRRIDKIQVQAASTSITSPTAAQTVLLWMSDGANAYVIDEFIVTVVTPSTTVAAFNTYKTYTNLVLPATYTLWVSTTVATTDATTSLVVTAFGGDY